MVDSRSLERHPPSVIAPLLSKRRLHDWMYEGYEEPVGPHVRPTQTVRNTKKLLGMAALIMSVMLLGSSFVTAVLIPLFTFGIVISVHVG
jgi:hypothetical protein